MCKACSQYRHKHGTLLVINNANNMFEIKTDLILCFISVSETWDAFIIVDFVFMKRNVMHSVFI